MFKFILPMLMLTSSAFATLGGSPGIPLPADAAQVLNTSATGGPSVKLGFQMMKKVHVLKAVYDFTKNGGGTGSSHVLRDANGGGYAVLPKHAIIKDCLIQGVTTPTSGGSATIAIGATTANDLKTATSYSSFASGLLVACVPTGSAANMIQVGGGPVWLTATIGTAALTAGKINVFIEYYLGR